MKVKAYKVIFLLQMMISVMVFAGMFFSIPVQAALKKDRLAYSPSPWVQLPQGPVEKFTLQSPGDRVFVAKGPVEEEYHPEPMESEESIRQKSEALKARKEQIKMQGILLVEPQVQGSETPQSGIVADEPVSSDSSQPQPGDESGPVQPLVIP